MKQLQRTGLIFICSSFFSCVALAHVLEKDAALATNTYNWSGFYAGLNAGVVKNTMRMTDLQATTFNATIEQITNPQFTGGFQLGVRRQMDRTQNSGVYGIEFSADFSNASSSMYYGSPFALYQLNSTNRLNGLYLLELTGGIAVNRTLLFMAAGLSWTDLSGRVVNLDGIPFFHSFSVSRTSFGPALSAGIEYAYNEKISLRFKADVAATNTYNAENDVGNVYQISNRVVQGTFGVNYKFA